MKVLLQNQNLFVKLKRHLQLSVVEFQRRLGDLNDQDRRRIAESGVTLFTQKSRLSDSFMAQIQSFNLSDNRMSLSDGKVQFQVLLRDRKVLESANCLDTPQNSLMVIQQWSYQLEHIGGEFILLLIIEKMTCIDIIDSLFDSHCQINFERGYQGINQFASESQQIHDYASLYYKSLQLVKQFLLKDEFLVEYYNSTRSKSQPKLLTLSSGPSKYPNDFAEGCVLQKISSLNVPNLTNIKKKRFLPILSHELQDIPSLQKQFKPFKPDYKQERVFLSNQQLLNSQFNTTDPRRELYFQQNNRIELNPSFDIHTHGQTSSNSTMKQQNKQIISKIQDNYQQNQVDNIRDHSLGLNPNLDRQINSSTELMNSLKLQQQENETLIHSHNQFEQISISSIPSTVQDIKKKPQQFSIPSVRVNKNSKHQQDLEGSQAFIFQSQGQKIEEKTNFIEEIQNNQDEQQEIIILQKHQVDQIPQDKD